MQPKRTVRSSLPPECHTIFVAFTNRANKDLLHPSDWERFYEFVNYCHSFHIKLRKKNWF